MKNLSELLGKENIKYNVLLVPEDKSETVKHFSIKLDKLLLICGIIIFVVIAALVYSIAITCAFNNRSNDLTAMNDYVTTLNTEKTALETQNDELQEKVAILSSTVNEKVAQQEELEAQMAQAYIPSGFPLKGTAKYNEEETTLDDNPIAIFIGSDGTSVLSTASGTVESIDSVDGVYVVTIDHENGYKSIYRNGTKPQVAVGDQVTSDTEIFRMETGYEHLGYQITLDGQYLDPLDLMEIYG